MGTQWSDREFGALPSITVAAHELKSPLALVRQLSLLLDDEAIDSDEARAIRRQIQLTSEQALATVTDLSHSANLQPSLFPLEPVNPLAVCRQIAEEAAPMLQVYGRNVSWPKRRRATSLVLANQKLLSRIMVNFINNAVKYSECTADIVVTMKQRDNMMRLAVRDFGPSMTRAEYRRLVDEMERRKTVKTRPESSGLGMYAASQFAKAMGGVIGLIRHRDGVTFYVDIPVSHQMSLL